MYQAYAVQKDWNFKVVSSQTTEVGGYREASASIRYVRHCSVVKLKQ